VILPWKETSVNESDNHLLKQLRRKISNLFFCRLSYALQWKHLKGHSTLKWKFCHHLLTLKLLQTWMSFFLLLNTKGDILKNVWNQAVVWHHWLPLHFLFLLCKSMVSFHYPWSKSFFTFRLHLNLHFLSIYYKTTITKWMQYSTNACTIQCFKCRIKVPVKAIKKNKNKF